MKHSALTLTLLIAALFFSSCSKDEEENIIPDNTNTNIELKAAEEYFNQNLKTLITAKCVSCHTGYHSSGSNNFSVFTNARNKASQMYDQVNQGTMPKGGSKLSDNDINKFKSFKELVDAIP